MLSRPCISHSNPTQHLQLDLNLIVAPKKPPKAGKSRAELQQTFDPSNQRITQSLEVRIKAALGHAVFNTTELLENILSLLPAKNLFGVIRVSKQFKSVIANCPALQETMFLRAGRGARAMASSGDGSHQRIIPYPPGCDHTSSIRYRLNFEQFTPTLLNPRLESCLVTEHKPGPPTLGWYPASQYHSELVRFKLEDYAPRDPQTGKLSQQMNFLDTHLTDPPCQDITISLHTAYEIPVSTATSSDGNETIYIRVHNVSPPVRTGPTIRDLVTTAFGLKGEVIKQSCLKGATVRPKPWLWKNSPLSNASMDELLDHFRKLGDHHASAMANRRTFVYLRLHNVMVQNSLLQQKSAPSQPR